MSERETKAPAGPPQRWGLRRSEVSTYLFGSPGHLKAVDRLHNTRQLRYVEVGGKRVRLTHLSWIRDYLRMQNGGAPLPEDGA